MRFFAQWLCENAECADRQRAHAVLKTQPVAGESPFLYLPFPLQVDIEESPVRRLLVHGEVGISKSYGLRWSLYKRCRAIPGYQALLLRETLPQLTLNHLQFMEREEKLLGDCEYKPGPRRMQFENDSIIHFGFCKDEDDIRQWRGPEFDEVAIDEAVNLLPKALRILVTRDRGSEPAREAMLKLGYEHGRSRLLTNPNGRAEMELETAYILRNPDPKEYPHYDPADYGHITGDAADNPQLAWNHKTSTMGGLNVDEYAYLAEGQWGVVENQFFKWWKPTRDELAR